MVYFINLLYFTISCIGFGIANGENIVICEDKTHDINCGNGRYISIESAKWGRENQHTCGYHALGCTNMEDKTSRIKSWCHEKQRCLISVSESEFGSPCWIPFVPWGYYMRIIYNCIACPSSLPISNCVEIVGSDCLTNSYCRRCYDGYYPHSGRCSRCKGIDGCEYGKLTCTNSLNSKCSKCRDKLLFQLQNNNAECARTCSWESRWCWPGKCSSGLAKDCTCAQGFHSNIDGTKAVCELENKANILECPVRIYSRSGDALPATGGSSECSKQNDFYGNLQVDYVTSEAFFEFTIVYNISAPLYVSDSHFGLTDASMIFLQIDTQGKETKIKEEIIKNNPTSSHPESHLHRALNVTYPVGKQLTNGHRLCFRFVAKAGGFLVSNNINNGAQTHIPYAKSTTSRDICYIFDASPPVHCKYVGNCENEPLYLSSRTTRDRNLTISFDGWFDPLPLKGNYHLASKIDTYEVTVYEVKESGLTDLAMDTSPVVPSRIIRNFTKLDILLPESNPSLYAIFLEVKDVANNIRQARRFVLFDNSSSIQIDHTKFLRVVSASSQTNFTWQTNHKQMCFSWSDRYYNNKFIATNLLKPIKPDFHGSITGVYEQYDGLLPVNGTHNVHGITRFRYELYRRNISLKMGSLTNISHQTVCVTSPVNDGDILRFQVEANDIMGNVLKDEVVYYIDESPPLIHDLGITRHGHTMLFVHSTTDLSKMVLQFKILDIHSGIRSVMWKIKTANDNVEFGHGSLSVTKLVNQIDCQHMVTCYCPAVGQCEVSNYTKVLNSLIANNTNLADHNRKYIFEVKATNNAHLSSTEDIIILVDDSPPASGVVMEGMANRPDIDYTSISDVTVNWHGFIDHESGIKFFLVGVSNTCLTIDDIENKNRSLLNLKETTDSSLVISLLKEGRYFVTVVAYNNAMERSKPVCSDGITLDKTPPGISNVSLSKGQIANSIGCINGTAWMIRENLKKVKLSSEACSRVCKESNDENIHILNLLPKEDVRSHDQAISAFLCNRLPKYSNETAIYVPSDKLHLSWDITEDLSQIDEVYIGFGSSVGRENLPDIIGYRKIKHIYQYRERHLALSSGTEFYMFLKVINKASLTATISIGPILIDETPPLCPAEIKTFLDRENVVVQWNNDTFVDFDQKEPIESVYFSIATVFGTVTPFLQWNRVNSQQCRGINSSCIKYPIHKLQQFDMDKGLYFYFILHAYNYAGHFCTTKTNSFQLPPKFPPGKGTVYDLDPDTLEYKMDVDVTLRPYTFCCSWKGFLHHKNVAFQVGVGSVEGTDNVLPFHNVSGFHIYCNSSRSLTFATKFYVTVQAVCEGGISKATSNGFTIIDKSKINDHIKITNGLGCQKDAFIEQRLNVTHQLSHNVSFQAKHPFIVGRLYTIIMTPVYSSTHLTGINIININATTDGVWTFIATETTPFITLNYTGPQKWNISLSSLSLCKGDTNTNILIQQSTNVMDIHWSIDKEMLNFVYHFKLGVSGHCLNQDDCSFNDIIKEITERNVHNNNHTFRRLQLSPGMYYKTFISTCFQQYCHSPVFSDATFVENFKPVIPFLTSSLDNITSNCSWILTEWDTAVCSSIEFFSKPVLYRVGIFKDRNGQKQLTLWNHIRPSASASEQVKSCFSIPSYLHSLMYTCLEVFCISGRQEKHCVPLNIRSDPNQYPNDKVYDVHANAEFLQIIIPSLSSKYIGGKLSLLHANEVDFILPSHVVAGVLSGAGGRLISWYIMQRKRLPINTCQSDIDCIYEDKSSEGYIVFKKVQLKEGNVFYICAKSNQTVIEREFFREEIPAIEACSNGFFIDSEPPKPGNVTMVSNNGYITDKSEVLIYWDDFQDSDSYKNMGYPSGVAFYQYAIGSYPYGIDVLPFTNNSMRTAVMVRDLKLNPGSIYYTTIKATDHVGLSTIALSAGVVFDETAPTQGVMVIDGIHSNKYLVTPQLFSIHWSGFEDKESGIHSFELAIGTTQKSQDILPFAVFNDNFAVFTNLNMLADGHGYFAILKVTNKAGLSTISTSSQFYVDSSPPQTPLVNDGPSTSQYDLDYQRESTVMHAHWTECYDPHSIIMYYRTGIGSKPNATDVIPFVYIGLQRDMQWKGSFLPGKRYYATVECCNRAQLCSISSSNGVIIDNSIPIPGLVNVGMSGRHSTYIGHSSSVHTRWIGFQDPESDIRHFEVCISTNQLACTITEFRNVLLTSSLTFTNVKMPVGEKLYVIVRAFNKAGMFVEKSSDHFIVDDTPPLLLQQPEFLLNEINSFNNSTQWDVSFVKLAWDFSDNDSPIVSQKIALRTHHEGHTAIETLEITNEKEVTMILSPKDWLRSGDIYYAIITACNAAHLCTSSKSKTILFDSTPPHLGGFKPPLTWGNKKNSFTVLYLTWYGFSDIESNVEQYFITVGETYSGNELSGGVKSFSHRGYSGNEQNGTLQLEKSVSVGQKIFVSIWARNNAGLYSPIAKISVFVDSTDINDKEGELLIEKHSCSAEYCNKDCTCAVVGGKCAQLKVNETCKEVTNRNRSVDLKVVLNNENPFSFSSACLRAEWFTNDSLNILRYEWSMGLEDMPIGDGIFDILHESVWYDIGKRSNIIHCLPFGKQLHHDASYVVYVRAWLSPNEYVTFTSSPIKIDLTPPAIRKGSFIKDSDRNCLIDFTYTNITDTVTTCWKKVFIDSQSKITQYEAYIGTDKGGDDVARIQDIGTRTTFTWTNLSLHAGTKYFITVRATNGVGLKSSLSSDGFIIDYENPYAGVVFNTFKFSNRQFQSSSDIFNVSWRGFEDHHSFIRYYMVGISFINDSNLELTMPFIKVGVHNSVKINKLNLKHNHRYKARVKAIDAAGYESAISESETVLIDKTPPSGFTCTKYTLRKNLVATYTDFDALVNDTYDFIRDKAYLLEMQVHESSGDAVCTLTIGSFSVILPTYLDFDGVLKTKYHFLSPFSESMPMTIDVKGAFNQSEIYVNLFECKSIRINENNDDALMVRQISPSTVSVCINVIDPESGIQNVLVGAGTTPNGFQIRSLSPLSLINHVSIDANIPHGTPVYITAKVKNHAGLENTFKSSKLILDHTPPIITDTEASICYNSSYNDTTITVDMQWSVMDKESNLKFCMCSLGESPKSGDIQQWTVSETLYSCHIYNITARHGTLLYGTVRCVNEVELYTDVGFDSVGVSLLPPDVPITESILNENNECCLDEPVISNKAAILLSWPEFTDFFQVMNYQCKIKQEEITVTEWLDVGKRTNYNLTAMRLRSHSKYTAYIRAFSKYKQPSLALNTSFFIERSGPVLSGRFAAVYKVSSDPYKVRLNWDLVFNLDHSLLKYYIVTVGTHKGMCDVLRYKETSTESLDLELESETKELYVVIYAVYCTDLTAIYRQVLEVE